MHTRRFFHGLMILFFLACSVQAEMALYSYEDAIEISARENKKVYLLFGGEHCPWCHKQKEVIINPSVADALDDYVVCHVDFSARRDLASKYRIRTIPVSLIIDKDENVEKRSVGYMDVAKFTSWLR